MVHVVAANLAHTVANAVPYLDVPVDAPVVMHILQALQHTLHDRSNDNLMQPLCKQVPTASLGLFSQGNLGQ